MPRRARLDAPGTLHHVIVRVIEKRRMVDDVADRKYFVERLGELATGTETHIYAWALMTNHVIDQLQKINEFISKICKNEKVPIEELQGGSRRRKASKVRARIAIGLVKTHGVTLAEVARQLGVSTSAISKIVKRANQ